MKDFYRRNNILNNLKYLYEEKESKLIEYKIKTDKLKELNADLDLFNKYDLIYNQIKARLQVAINNYEEERLEILISEVEHDLALVFPEDNFTIKFIPETYRNTPILKLFSGHQGGKMQPTKFQHGRMCRQVIGLSITSNIQLLLGCEILLLDEPLNSGDADSEKQASAIIKKLVDNGYQIIYTEHKHEAYNELNRREIHLRRNLETNTTIVEKVLDFNIS